MAFFAHSRGTVARVRGPWARQMVFSVDVDEITPLQRGIVTQAGVSQDGNFQFLHTLNDTIFVYVFGDRISELTVSGVAFTQAGCTGEGISELLLKYQAKKISRKAEPIAISFGPSETFESFLTGMKVDVVDPERMLAQWTYRFASFPAS